MAEVEILSKETGKKSTLVKYEPVMREDKHKTYESTYGIFYYFLVTFENGDIGEAKSNRQEPTWKRGSEYNYDYTKKKIGKYYTNEITGMKLFVNNPSYGGKSVNTNSDLGSESHVMQIAIKMASLLIKDNIITIEQIDSSVDKYYSWLLAKVKEHPDKVWRIFSVIESAVTIAIATNNTKAIFPLADKFFLMCDINKEE